MTNFACTHHIEIGVIDGPGTVHVLREQYTFKVTATRKNEFVEQWLLVKNNTRFLVTCLKKLDMTAIQNDDFVINWAPSSNLDQPSAHQLPSKDSVFNVAFQVKDIEACVKRLSGQGVTFSKHLRTVRDSLGSVKTCTIKSCVGDIFHTLIEKGSYSGDFLPGFTPVTMEDVNDSSENLDPLLATFDHVALSVEMNTAMTVIDWYERCLGMKRFLINSEEDRDNGLVLSNANIGLRLRAMEYWKCAEVGLLTPHEDGISSRLSMVVAEGLPPVAGCTEENQIESWMKQHGGPGIQHIAITSTNIKRTVKCLKLRGVTFANAPPDAYYSEMGRLSDILRVGEDADALKSNGILIDTEADGIHEVTNDNQNMNGHVKESYLLQIFTKPVFKKDPFFLELIQREGATGFGSGNVEALYRSVQSYIVGQKKDDANTSPDY